MGQALKGVGHLTSRSSGQVERCGHPCGRCRPYPSHSTHKRSTNVRRQQRPFGLVTIGYPESHVRTSRADLAASARALEGCDDGSCWQRNPDHPWWGDVVTPTCRITHQQPRGAWPHARDDTKQRGRNVMHAFCACIFSIRVLHAVRWLGEFECRKSGSAAFKLHAGDWRGF